MAAADLVITGPLLDQFQPAVGPASRAACVDMVMVSADLPTVPPEEIAALQVRATVLAGCQVYQQ
ncbi:hypothetical protein [Mycobacterium simiae]|uniref:hypothetical protein n=1 Tax=Mycobacterium simiae TaxID=1784 RepID=UPI00358F825B